MAVDGLAASSTTSWTEDNTILKKYAYIYHYDKYNRCVYKKLPGCEPIYTVYDAADRAIFTQDGNQRDKGEWSFSIPAAFNRVALTSTCKNTMDCTFTLLGNLVVKATQVNATNVLKGYTISGIALNTPSVLSVNYYDTYDFLGFNGILNNATTAYTEVTGYGKRSPKGCKGQQTGRWTASLSGNSGTTQPVHTVMYYDGRYRLIQQKGNNPLNGTEQVYAAYNFEGSPTEEKHVRTVPGQATLTEIRQNTYDLANRLLKTVYRLDNNAPILLVDNLYDEIGRLKADKRNGHPKPRTGYDYNIRSWTKKVNGPLFSQTLNYQEASVEGVEGVTGNIPRYNGNISNIAWRAGRTASNAYGLIDNLSLSYDGNQLKAVNDNAINSVYGDSFEFKDGAKQAVEYNYDANGNLTRDLNKKITDIQYNCLNLPRRIQFADGNSISYLYAADGTKLRATHVINGVTTTTDYCGNAIYENGVLTKLLTEQGYVTLADKIYHYFIQDHQGNNRVVVNQNGAAEETSQYYPFGGVFASSPSVQPYKYNGKELDRKGGLDWCDYGARHYDAAIGRWHTIDLMAEKYYNSSPFVYCANNPIRFIDPTGLAWRQTYDEDHDGFQMPSGYAWVDEAESYNDDGTLKKGLYAQAIFFSDNGIFNATSNKNMGSSTATVYLADGTMKTFDANTLPSSEDFATVPEGVYHATVGSHKGQYTALRMSDTDKKGRIDLGTSNPAHPERTYAEGINIHKPGLNNLTGFDSKKRAISAGCLLIDRNNWSSFINLFDNDSQRTNTVSVTVSRSIATPINENRLPAFNFILNGSRNSFFSRKF